MIRRISDLPTQYNVPTKKPRIKRIIYLASALANEEGVFKLYIEMEPVHGVMRQHF